MISTLICSSFYGTWGSFKDLEHFEAKKLIFEKRATG